MLLYEFGIPNSKEFKFSFIFDRNKNFLLKISSACNEKIEAKFVLKSFEDNEVEWESEINDICNERIKYLPLRLNYGKKYYKFEIYINNELAVTKKLKF